MLKLSKGPWSIIGNGIFDDECSVEIMSAEKSIPVAEVFPSGGMELNEWSEECIGNARGIVAVPELLKTLEAIRKIGYRAGLEKAPKALLECVALAEAALCFAETGRMPE